MLLSFIIIHNSKSQTQTQMFCLLMHEEHLRIKLVHWQK